MDKNLVIAIILGVLVVISVVQAVQLFSLKNGVPQSASGTQSVASSSGSSGAQPLPSNIQNLPSMVGGC